MNFQINGSTSKTVPTHLKLYTPSFYTDQQFSRGQAFRKSRTLVFTPKLSHTTAEYFFLYQSAFPNAGVACQETKVSITALSPHTRSHSWEQTVQNLSLLSKRVTWLAKIVRKSPIFYSFPNFSLF